jgi:glycosyltransferase involved in cell wall biosynthesis
MEGHPIALLEAISYEVPALASAIPENLLIPLPRDSYFPLGDTAALARLIKATAVAPPTQSVREAARRAAREQFGWRQSALATCEVYERVIAGATPQDRRLIARNARSPSRRLRG